MSNQNVSSGNVVPQQTTTQQGSPMQTVQTSPMPTVLEHSNNNSQSSNKS